MIQALVFCFHFFIFTREKIYLKIFPGWAPPIRTPPIALTRPHGPNPKIQRCVVNCFLSANPQVSHTPSPIIILRKILFFPFFFFKKSGGGAPVPALFFGFLGITGKSRMWGKWLVFKKKNRLLAPFLIYPPKFSPRPDNGGGFFFPK